MIKLDLSTAVALYLLFSVVAMLVLWIFFEHRAGKSKRFVSDDRNLWHCSICDYTYVDSRHEDISQCPRCRSYIERASRNSG